MRTACIVQARMSSTRCPGKSGRLILGKPQIWYVMERLKRVSGIDAFMLAVPHESNGDILLEAAWDLGFETLDYRGNPANLIHRYALAADILDARVVVRVPGDNTFVDPNEVSRILQHYDVDPPPWNWLTTNLDRDVLGNGYPGGLGAEVYDARYFSLYDRVELSEQQREHPHKVAFDNHCVRTIQAPAHLRMPENKFSVDTEEEWNWTKWAYENWYPSNPNFGIQDILGVK